MTKGKLFIGAISIAAVAGAFAYGRFKSAFQGGGTLVTWIPGKSFYIFGVYPWDGEHLDHIRELAGHLDGIYDSEEDYGEIDHLNRLFYEED